MNPGDQPAPPEARCLWDWIARETPALTLNFHTYTQASATGDFPWEGLYTAPDEAFPDAAARERQRLLAVARIAGARPAEAVEPYERALALAPGNVEWRLEYARLLLSLGRAEAAEKQAVALVRLDPERQEFRDLLEDAIRKRRP